MNLSPCDEFFYTELIKLHLETVALSGRFLPQPLFGTSKTIRNKPTQCRISQSSQGQIIKGE